MFLTRLKPTQSISRNLYRLTPQFNYNILKTKPIFQTISFHQRRLLTTSSKNEDSNSQNLYDVIGQKYALGPRADYIVFKIILLGNNSEYYGNKTRLQNAIERIYQNEAITKDFGLAYVALLSLFKDFFRDNTVPRRSTENIRSWDAIIAFAKSCPLIMDSRGSAPLHDTLLIFDYMIRSVIKATFIKN